MEFVEQMREENAQQRRELEHLRHTHVQVLQQFHALREGWVDFLRQLGVTVPALPSFSFPSPSTFPLHQPLNPATPFQSTIPLSPSRQPPPIFDADKPPPAPPLNSLARSPSATRYANIEDGERNLFIDSPPPLSRFSHIPTQIPRSTYSPTPKSLERITNPFPSSANPSSSSSDILASLQDIEDKLTQIKMESRHDLSPSPSSASLYPPPSSYPTPRSPSPRDSSPSIAHYSSHSFTYHDDEPSLFATPRPRLSKSQDAATSRARSPKKEFSSSGFDTKQRTRSPQKELSSSGFDARKQRTRSPKKETSYSSFDAATSRTRSPKKEVSASSFDARIAKSGQTKHMLLDEVEQMEKMMKRWSSLDVEDFLENGGEVEWEREEEKKERRREDDGRNGRGKRRSLSSIGELEERERRGSKGKRDSKEFEDPRKAKRSYENYDYANSKTKDRERDTDKYRQKERDRRISKRDYHDEERDFQRDRSKEKEWERQKQREWEREREKEREREARDRERDKCKQWEKNQAELHKRGEQLHGNKSEFSSEEEEIWRAHEKSYERVEEGESEISNEEVHESDISESYLSDPHPQSLYYPPPPPPQSKQKEPGLGKVKKRQVDSEDEHPHLSPRSLLPHLLDEIKAHALRNSAERVDAIAATEASRRRAQLRASRQSELMEQIKALKPNSGARLAAIQDAEVHRTEEQEAKRKEFLDSFARRFVV